MSHRSPPNSRSPVSKDVVEIVKKKIGAPAGPPPSNMTSFTAPKSYQGQAKEYIDDDDYDDDHGDDDDNDDDNYDHDYNSRDRRHDRDNDEDNDPMDGYYGRQHVTDSSSRDRNPSKSSSQQRSKSSYDDHDYDDDRSHDYDDDRDRHQSSSRRPSQQRPDSRSDHKSSTPQRRSSLDDKHLNAGNNASVLDRKNARGPSTGRFNDSPSKQQQSYASPSLSSSISNSPAKPIHNIFNFQPLLKATYRDLRNFAWTPCEEGMLVRCYIERDRAGSHAFTPFYSLCADMDDGTGRELMVCRKVWKSRSPHYIFSLKPDDLYRKREQRSRLYLGKLRGISPTEYVLYDNGICRAPDSSFGEDEEVTEEEVEAREQHQRFTAEGNAATDDGSLYRKELAIISFNTKKRPPPPGVRGAEICLLPRHQVSDEKGTVAGGTKAPPLSYVSTFRKIRESGKQNVVHRSKMIIIHEKTSRYDPLSACLVDLKGRASVPSVKNCLYVQSDAMCDSGANPTEDEGKDFVLAMGKSADDCFNMDFRYPMSLLQAFAICVARFDANLSWQR